MEGLGWGDKPGGLLLSTRPSQCGTPKTRQQRTVIKGQNSHTTASKMCPLTCRDSHGVSSGENKQDAEKLAEWKSIITAQRQVYLLMDVSGGYTQVHSYNHIYRECALYENKKLCQTQLLTKKA